MVEVNGQCLIDRMLNQLSALKLAKIIIITGYQGSKLREHVLQNHPQLKVEFIDNTVYERTNNIYSLWLAREQMAADDTLLLESDIILITMFSDWHANARNLIWPWLTSIDHGWMVQWFRLTSTRTAY